MFSCRQTLQAALPHACGGEPKNSARDSRVLTLSIPPRPSWEPAFPTRAPALQASGFPTLANSLGGGFNSYWWGPGKKRNSNFPKNLDFLDVLINSRFYYINGLRDEFIQVNIILNYIFRLGFHGKCLHRCFKNPP